MSGQSSRRSLGVHFAQGLLMGGADAIPGVSGGTMALIVGIYERLIASIGNAFRAAVALIRFDLAEARTRLHGVEWGLVVPLVLGIGSAIVAAAYVIEPLLEEYPAESKGLFLGMVAASLAIPWSRIARPDGRSYAIAAGTAAIAFVLSGLPPGTIAEPSTVQVLASAAVAICAMILPGVSGAFLLLVLGMYEPTLAAVRERDLVYLGAFGLGAGAGLGTFSLVLSFLLRRHHDTTMAALVGLMLGSLRALWPWQDESRALLAPTSGGSLIGVVAITALGLGAVTALERFGRRRAGLSDPATTGH